jgi:transposase
VPQVLVPHPLTGGPIATGRRQLLIERRGEEWVDLEEVERATLQPVEDETLRTLVRDVGPSRVARCSGVHRVDLPRFRGEAETGGNSLRKELTMPRSKPPYPREFREEAVRLVRSSGRPIAQIARELGIAHGTLSAWVKQAELDAGLRSDGLTTAEREELRRLRRENRILREEREILKKAAAFFARETESKP